MPAMLDQHETPLTPDFSMIYYKQIFLRNPENIQSIPVGLKIIAGDHSISPQPKRVAKWRCKRDGRFTGDKSTIPQTDCRAGDELLVIISFPSCWDGKRLDSADHKSHMAYPSRKTGCPASHPVELPHMTMNIGYAIDAGSEQSYKRWRLSSDHEGQPGGSSVHADYWAAWNPDIQDLWRKNCINAGRDCRGGLLGDAANRVLKRR